MSWGEVKKVNSDLSVPLDERMGYLNGIVKRGCVTRTLSVGAYISVQSETIPESVDEEVLSVNGSGFVYDITLKAAKGSYYTSQNGTASVSLTIVADGEEVGTFSATATNNGGTSSGSSSEVSSTIRIVTDLDSRYCDGDIAGIIANTGENINFKTNNPISFEKSLKIKCSHSVCNYTYGGNSEYIRSCGMATVVYTLT